MKASDTAPLKQINFTAYYDDWATNTGLPGFSPARTWRIVAVCRPPGETGVPVTTSGCVWNWTSEGSGGVWEAEVAFDWYSEKPDSGSGPPWQPQANKARDLDSNCKVARLSFDVYDKAGYRRLAPAGTTPPGDCSDIPAVASRNLSIATTGGALSAVYLEASTTTTTVTPPGPTPSLAAGTTASTGPPECRDRYLSRPASESARPADR